MNIGTKNTQDLKAKDLCGDKKKESLKKGDMDFFLLKVNSFLKSVTVINKYLLTNHK